MRMLRTPVTVLSLLAVVSVAACSASLSSRPAVGLAMKTGAMAPAGAETGPEFDTESYAHITENPFKDPKSEPLSTFAVDVDTASYANVRRFVREGRLPPADAVRIEELLNSFRYAYPEPDPGDVFSVTAEQGQCPWNADHRLVRLGIRGRDIDQAAPPARNLVFLLDVSGSMQPADKLPLVKQAMRLLVERLTPADSVGIAVYAGAAGMVLEPTDGGEQTAILDAIENLQAGGSTNGGEGIRLAYRMARGSFRRGGVNRVILATDGDFNVGTTSEGQLVRLIEEEREHGVFLTVLGVGTGNLKDSTMERLADHGNGNYAYLDTIQEARRVLVEEAGGTLVTIAKDVKVQVEFNPERVGAYRLIGYENRLMSAADFDDDRKDGGEIGAGHRVTALYEVAPPGSGAARGTPELRYRGEAPPSDASFSGELLQVSVRFKDPDGDRSRLRRFVLPDAPEPLSATSDDFRFAAAVAAFGMTLRESEHRGTATLGMARDLAAAALADDPRGRRQEFVTLVDAARALAD